MVLAVVGGLLSIGPTGAASATARRAAPPGTEAAAARQPALATPSQPARASRQSRGKAPLALVIATITPKTVRPNSKITITGQVRNQSGQQMNGASIRLRWRSRPVNGRTEMTQFAGNAAPALVEAETPRPLTGSLAAGGEVGWRLTATARQIGMTVFGAYPIAVEVLNGGGQPVVTQTTFLTFMPSSKALQPKPTKVAWVWPLIDQPHRLNDTTFLDSQLETALAPSGRLGALAQAAEQATKKTRTPITWAIDPALLDDAQEMAKGYTVKGDKQGKTVKKPKSEVAQTWLEGVRASGEPYFTTPYADPDAVALIRQRMSRHLKVAYGGMEVAKGILGRPPASAIGWPVNGVAGQQTLDGMADNGTQTFLMSSEVLRSTDPQGYTADATTTLQTAHDTKRTLVYDATISDVISADTRSPGAALLAEQRFLAETAMITAEMPNRPRTLVIAPQRRWNPKPKFAENLLTYTAGAQWLKGVPLGDVQNAAPGQRTFTGYPVGYERYELGATYLKNVRDIAARANRFASIFDSPSNAYDQSVLRMESTYWRGRDRRARSYRQTVAASLDAAIDMVHLVPGKRVGLAGDSGLIPATVANDLKDRTVNVVLRVTSENPRRLEIGGGANAEAGTGREWVLKIGPENKETVHIPVKAYANGYTNLTLELLAPQQNKKFGEDRSITVHTTGYGQMALLITGSALAVLFIGVGMRVLRAKRRSGAEGSDEPGAGGHAGG
jgi:hypothetical protein